MGTALRPYVNCHYCNARISIGYARIDAIRQASRGALLECRACGNSDSYEACMVRDPLLMPGAGLDDVVAARPRDTIRAA